MAQWVNRLWNNIFVNLPPFPLLCEISGALHLAQLGLMAGWLAGRQVGWVASWLANKIQVNFELFTSFNQGTASLQPDQCIPVCFSDKVYCKVDFLKCKFFGSHTISYH